MDFRLLDAPFDAQPSFLLTPHMIKIPHPPTKEIPTTTTEKPSPNDRVEAPLFAVPDAVDEELLPLVLDEAVFLAPPLPPFVAVELAEEEADFGCSTLA